MLLLHSNSFGLLVCSVVPSLSSCELDQKFRSWKSSDQKGKAPRNWPTMVWLRFKFHHLCIIYSFGLLNIFISAIFVQIFTRSQRHRRQQKMARRWIEHPHNNRYCTRLQLTYLHRHWSPRGWVGLGIQINDRACNHTLYSYILAVVVCVLLRCTKST